MVGDLVVLQGGPGGGQQMETSGPTLVWRACLYERSGEHQWVKGGELRVYAHVVDCCEGYGRGDTEQCE
ncbi:hypothetical protein [Plantactinospora sp. BB1]|uniref:hypothetical protein n=1 Tax=Plantactinospora sp. BB1 TaxID=2071627 RepID=UPI000D15EB5F|nr:hypothetical protein [Plantactinospora sp. BB1]AVT39624.1 hypothetical protein C6W10_27870 [Plantactinospora sp. BB1]